MLSLAELQMIYTDQSAQPSRDQATHFVFCFNCRKEGDHTDTNCPIPKRCFICFETNHAAYHCPNNPKVGSVEYDPEKRCTGCGDRGHLAAHCKISGNHPQDEQLAMTEKVYPRPLVIHSARRPGVPTEAELTGYRAQLTAIVQRLKAHCPSTGVSANTLEAMQSVLKGSQRDVDLFRAVLVLLRDADLKVPPADADEIRKVLAKMRGAVAGGVLIDGPGGRPRGRGSASRTDTTNVAATLQGDVLHDMRASGLDIHVAYDGRMELFKRNRAARNERQRRAASGRNQSQFVFRPDEVLKGHVYIPGVTTAAQQQQQQKAAGTSTGGGGLTNAQQGGRSDHHAASMMAKLTEALNVQEVHTLALRRKLSTDTGRSLARGSSRSPRDEYSPRSNEGGSNNNNNGGGRFQASLPRHMHPTSTFTAEVLESWMEEHGAGGEHDSSSASFSAITNKSPPLQRSSIHNPTQRSALRTIFSAATVPSRKACKAWTATSQSRTNKPKEQQPLTAGASSVSHSNVNVNAPSQPPAPPPPITQWERYVRTMPERDMQRDARAVDRMLLAARRDEKQKQNSNNQGDVDENGGGRGPRALEGKEEDASNTKASPPHSPLFIAHRAEEKVQSWHAQFRRSQLRGVEDLQECLKKRDAQRRCVAQRSSYENVRCSKDRREPSGMWGVACHRAAALEGAALQRREVAGAVRQFCEEEALASLPESPDRRMNNLRRAALATLPSPLQSFLTELTDHILLPPWGSSESMLKRVDDLAAQYLQSPPSPLPAPPSSAPPTHTTTVSKSISDKIITSVSGMAKLLVEDVVAARNTH